MMPRAKEPTVSIEVGGKKSPPLPVSEFTRQVDKAAAQMAAGNAQSAQEALRSLVDQIERLEAEKAATANEIKEVYAEAKGGGFDVKVLRLVVRRRKRRRQEVREEDEAVQLYEEQLEP